MTYANPRQRRKLIKGLRELADFLDAHPEIPAPLYLDAHVFPPRASDAAMRANIDVIAAMLDRQAKEDHGHYTATRRFGPVSYHAVAISAERTARYAAWDSYHDTITPDTASPVPPSHPDRR